MGMLQDIPNSQTVYVAEKSVRKLIDFLIQNKYWFAYEYNRRCMRHEFTFAMGVDLIKDIPSKLNNYITPEHATTRDTKGPRINPHD